MRRRRSTLLAESPSKHLSLRTRKDPGAIYRVGYAPHPWAWVPWQFGPFTGRWDDPEQRGYRVIYSGTTPFACYVEVLANFRADPVLALEVTEIQADVRDILYSSVEAGTIPRSWFRPRRLAQAKLKGAYVDVQHAASIAILRQTFYALARSLAFPDLDGAAIRTSEPRELTQQISRFLWNKHHTMGSCSSHISGIG